MWRADVRVDSVSWRRPDAAVVRRRLAAHVRLPLHRDAYALALNSAFTAATGLIYWIVAANAFSAHAVGLNSALISAMTLLSGIASLNLPNIIVRFLPESGDRTLARVVCAYAAAAGLAACAALVFILGVTWWTPPLRFLRFDGSLQAWFVFSTVAWCLFTIQDSVLTALGRAIWVPVENAVFSVLKIALLVAAATALPRYGIFVSWTIAMLVSVAGVNLLIFTRLMRPSRLRRCDPVDVRNRAFVRYFAANYACSVAWLSSLYLMPLIVTAVAGATTNAYWALAFTGTALAVRRVPEHRHVADAARRDRSRRTADAGAQGRDPRRSCAHSGGDCARADRAAVALAVRPQLRRAEHDGPAVARDRSAAEPADHALG